MLSEEVVFRGLDGTECEDFIHHIHKLARSESRLKDNGWMATQAMSFMVGGALRWYDALEPEIQSDWGQLRRALLKQWPEPVTRAAPPGRSGAPGSTDSTIVLAATSATPNFRLSLVTRFEQVACRIRVVTPEGQSKGYLSSPITSGIHVGALTVNRNVQMAILAEGTHQAFDGEDVETAIRLSNTRMPVNNTEVALGAAFTSKSNNLVRCAVLVAWISSSPVSSVIYGPGRNLTNSRRNWRLDAQGRLKLSYASGAVFVAATIPTGEDVVCLYTHPPLDASFEANRVHLVVDPLLM